MCVRLTSLFPRVAAAHAAQPLTRWAMGGFTRVHMQLTCEVQQRQRCRLRKLLGELLGLPDGRTDPSLAFAIKELDNPSEVRFDVLTGPEAEALDVIVGNKFMSEVSAAAQKYVEPLRQKVSLLQFFIRVGIAVTDFQYGWLIHPEVSDVDLRSICACQRRPFPFDIV